MKRLPKHLENTQEVEIEEGSYKYKVTYTENEKSIYLFDITETSRVYELYDNEKPIIATTFLDNYDEITQNMNDSQRSEVNSLITNVINDCFVIIANTIEKSKKSNIKNHYLLYQQKC